VTSGEAPLSVTFSINVTDVDGDAVSWTLDADGDGTPDLEGNGTGGASFTYESQGNFTAVLNATDGSATATASLGITVHAAVPQGPCGAEPEPCVIAVDKWVFFWSNGECHVKPDYYDEAAGHYLNDRPGSLPVVGGDAPYGTGFVTGGGTWVYEESNGVPGLQIGTSAEAANYTKCANPDTLIF
jgi:PKD repeat protein